MPHMVIVPAILGAKIVPGYTAYREHHVQAGETLRGIAAAECGNGNLFTACSQPIPTPSPTPIRSLWARSFAYPKPEWHVSPPEKARATLVQISRRPSSGEVGQLREAAGLLNLKSEFQQEPFLSDPGGQIRKEQRWQVLLRS